MTLMKTHTDSNKIVLNTKSAFRILTFLSWNGWQHLPPNTGFITSWLSILQSPHLSLSALISFYHLILSLMGFHPQVQCSGALQTKPKGEWAEMLWLHLFICCLWAFSKLCAFFFSYMQGMTTESESTCSRVPPDLRCDGLSGSGMEHLDRSPRQPKLLSLPCLTAVWISYLLFCLFTLD